MKLSVKLLSGLALMALVAVAVIGLSNSASAAVDGKVYVTNSASKLTSESGNPTAATTGGTARKTATTVYGTYTSSASTGTSARDIVTNSDSFIVTVVDSDLNITRVVTSGLTTAAGVAHNGYDVSGAGTSVVAGFASAGFNLPGETAQITLSASSSSPIIGDKATIAIFKTATNTAVPGIVVKTINYAGGGTAATPAIITLEVISGVGPGTGPTNRLIIRYNSSDKDVITASIKSVVDVTGSVITLTETGRNTGRFEGTVLVKERQANFLTGTNTVHYPSLVNASIPAIAGPITVTYTDAVTAGSATKVARTATYYIDVTPPVSSISAPVTASETQSRTPAFAGIITDNGSGLDVSTFTLQIDSTVDQANAALVTSAGARAAVGAVASYTHRGTAAGVSTSAWADGVSTQAWTWAQVTSLPSIGSTTPNHTVDFQARVSDLAGNIGYSDSNTVLGDPGTGAGETLSGTGAGRHGNQPHTIKIDLIVPSILSAHSGTGQNLLVTPAVDKDNVRDTIKVTFDGNVDAASVTADDFQVVFSGVGGATYVPASVVITGAVVFLDLDVTIPSNNVPTVKIKAGQTIKDVAGNSATSLLAGSSKKSLDKMAPVITVVRSLGSGTGTGTEAADSLTKDKMTITVTSDENLQSSPVITVSDLTAALAYVSSEGNVLNGAAMVSQGSNVFSIVVGKSTSASGARAVKIVSTDSATNAITTGLSTVKAYTLDLSVSTPTSVPASAGTTTQSNPFLTTDYLAGGETASVTITSATLQEAALTAEDVTASVVASADSKVFFLQPTTALNNAKYTYIVKAVDAAGNKLTTTTTFTKSDRKDFVISLFAGWNAVSVPSNPLVTEIGSVLTNEGIKQVVAYDATTPSQPWRIASKVGSGAYSSQTEPGLTSVEAGPGYWVETSDFEDQTVALEGPTGPGDAQPSLSTIATGSGWNLVGVVDQSRTLTQKANKDGTLTRPKANGLPPATNVSVATYFNTVNNGRSYVFNTVQSQFNELGSADTVTIGSGIWVFISANNVSGDFPPIVP